MEKACALSRLTGKPFPLWLKIESLLTRTKQNVMKQNQKGIVERARSAQTKEEAVEIKKDISRWEYISPATKRKVERILNSKNLWKPWKREQDQQ